MNTQYRISFRESKALDLLKILEQNRIKIKCSKLPGDADSMISFDIKDDHASWVEVKEKITQYKLTSIPKNIFSKKELKNAAWCRLKPISYIGYPQPEEQWQETHFTYEGYDAQNGTYLHQAKPFKISKNPTGKFSHFMTLHWTYALFASQNVINTLVKQKVSGFVAQEVIIKKSGLASEILAQISVSKITEVSANLLGHKYSFRNEKVAKFQPHTIGYLEYPYELLRETQDFLLSKEWFGDGQMAYREILVSRKVVNIILDEGWKGIYLEPVKILPES